MFRHFRFVNQINIQKWLPSCVNSPIILAVPPTPIFSLLLSVFVCVCLPVSVSVRLSLCNYTSFDVVDETGKTLQWVWES